MGNDESDSKDEDDDKIYNSHTHARIWSSPPSSSHTRTHPQANKCSSLANNSNNNTHTPHIFFF